MPVNEGGYIAMPVNDEKATMCVFVRVWYVHLHGRCCEAIAPGLGVLGYKMIAAKLANCPPSVEKGKP